MSATAIQLALERSRRDGAMPRQRPQLRVVHDADRPAATVHEPRPRIGARVSVALNKVFAFCLVIVACISIGVAAYAAGSNDHIMRENGARIAEIEEAELPPIIPQVGEFDRITGQMK